MLRLSDMKKSWQIYRTNKAATLGLAVVVFFALVAIFAPFISPRGPFDVGADTFEPPGPRNPMGTDDLGRDILSQVVHGTRVSLLVGLTGAGTTTVIGVLVGLISGYYGGAVDDLLMRVTEFSYCIPRFFLLLFIAIVFGADIWITAMVIAVSSWPGTARLVRSEVLSIRERSFVEAARAIGASDISIMFDEILPNAIPPAIVNGTMQISNVILLEAALSFIGLGDPNLMSWGFILNNAQRFLRYSWWMPLFPGIAIFILALSFNLVGDGVNDALNPRFMRR